MAVGRLVAVAMATLLSSASSLGVRDCAACSGPHQRPFSSYQFAPNGVCVSPRLFHCPASPPQPPPESTTRTTTATATTTEQEQPLPPVDGDGDQYFTLRNVPGTGDCMFLAVALATATSMGLGGNHALLQAIARETRDVVASVLDGHRAKDNNTTLVVTGRTVVRARTLLAQSARELGVTPNVYVQRLRTEGRYGGLYGGGPELTVLSNVLRRPISVYELTTQDKDDDMDVGEDAAMVQTIVCKGVFGDGVFRDPLLDVPQSAVLAQHGSTTTTTTATTSLDDTAAAVAQAYHWHLHILVVDADGGDKHACVLLPTAVATAANVGE